MKHLAQYLEWRDATAWAGYLWVFLGVALLAPFPMFGWPLPERAVPIMWLLVAGGLVGCSMVARASVPFAALLVWAMVKAAQHTFRLRELQLLALMLMAGLLYAAARDLPDRIARLAAWAFVIGAGWETLLGLFNAMGAYPWMQWVSAEHAGKPMGFLTHPNYWGSMMALALPLVWALVGIPAALVLMALILRTISAGPVISAAIGCLVMAWPLFGRRVRWAVAGGGAVAIATTMTLHEWRLSGRREVWQVAWPEVLRWPLTGQGLGEWRSWADQYNQAKGSFFATLQAHNEVYQLVFELGLIGLILAMLWGWQAYRAARVVWAAAPAERLPGEWWQFGRAPLERAWVAIVVVAVVNSFGSPTFHLPGQAGLVLLALARVQADAAALTPTPTPPRGTRRRYAEAE